MDFDQQHQDFFDPFSQEVETDKNEQIPPRPVSSQQNNRTRLGIVSFRPRGADQTFIATLNNDTTLTRMDKVVKYAGVLQFIDAVEREILGIDDSDMTMMMAGMGRVSIGRGSTGSTSTAASDIDQDLIFEKDPLSGVKMEHSNVWI